MYVHFVFLIFLQDLLTCRLCLKRIELYNKVAHQKYLMYIECAKRVNDKKLKDPSKDTTVILNELLADEKWLNEVLSCLPFFCLLIHFYS